MSTTRPRLAALALTLSAGCAASSTPEAREERPPPNHVALFLGATDEEGSSSGSFGVEYERRLSQLIGLGLVFEFTPVLGDRVVTAPSLYLHPVGGLVVLVTPGTVHQEDETLPLLRTGLGWEFELGAGFTLSPELNYDLVSGSDDALVYGIALGYGF